MKPGPAARRPRQLHGLCGPAQLGETAWGAGRLFPAVAFKNQEDEPEINPVIDEHLHSDQVALIIQVQQSKAPGRRDV